MSQRISVSCPSCIGLLSFTLDQVGATGPCAHCQQPLIVPAPQPVFVTCRCGTVSQFGRELVGQSGPCRGCGGQIVVPAPGPVPATAASAAAGGVNRSLSPSPPSYPAQPAPSGHAPTAPAFPAQQPGAFPAQPALSGYAATAPAFPAQQGAFSAPPQGGGPAQQGGFPAPQQSGVPAQPQPGGFPAQQGGLPGQQPGVVPAPQLESFGQQMAPATPLSAAPPGAFARQTAPQAAVPGAYSGPPPAQMAPPPEVPLGPAHRKALAAIEKEAAKKGMRVAGARLVQIGQEVTTGESMKAHLAARFSPFGASMRTDRVLGVNLESREGRFLLAAPFSGNTMFGHEFASILPVALPSHIYVERGLLGAFSEGRYFGSGGEEDPLARAASDAYIAEGIEWDWESGRLKVKLKWGMQWVGTSPSESLLLYKTAKIGIVFRDFGLEWYLKRRRAALEFHAAQASGPPPPADFPFPTLTQLFPLT